MAVICQSPRPSSHGGRLQILLITYSGSRPGRAQYKRRSKVRKVSLITLIAGLAVSVISPAFSQVNTGSINTISQGTFNLAEAYPCAVGTYAANLGITNEQIFDGVCPSPGSPPGAAPGVLCLRRTGLVLDVNCFAIIPSGQSPPCFVQGYQLT